MGISRLFGAAKLQSAPGADNRRYAAAMPYCSQCQSTVTVTGKTDGHRLRVQRTMHCHQCSLKRLSSLLYVRTVSFVLDTALGLALGQIFYISAVNDEVSQWKRPDNATDDQNFSYHYGWAFYAAGSSFICLMVNLLRLRYHFCSATHRAWAVH